MPAETDLDVLPKATAVVVSSGFGVSNGLMDREESVVSVTSKLLWSLNISESLREEEKEIINRYRGQCRQRIVETTEEDLSLREEEKEII